MFFIMNFVAKLNSYSKDESNATQRRCHKKQKLVHKASTLFLFTMCLLLSSMYFMFTGLFSFILQHPEKSEEKSLCRKQKLQVLECMFRKMFIRIMI